MAFKRGVLIVDDEWTVLDFLKNGLSSYADSIDLFTAPSAEKALQILDSQRVHLVATDIRMPGMDGFELILRAREKNPDTRFIVMTAYGSDRLFEKSRQYGAIDYLTKPFDLELFVQKMFQALKPSPGFRAAKLQGFQLTDALQLVHLAHKSHLIRVRTEFGEECFIYMKKGEVVHAVLEELEGEQAFYKIMGLEGGEIESLPLPAEVPVTIRRPLAALILEGIRLKDEAAAAKGVSRPSPAPLAPRPQLQPTQPQPRGQGRQPAPPTPRVRKVPRASRTETLVRLLRTLQANTAEILGSAVVSHDGFILASHLPAETDEDLIGAMSVALLSVASRASEELRQGRLEQVFVQGNRGYLVMLSGESEFVLTVLASKKAKLGLLFLDMKRGVKQIEKLLDQRGKSQGKVKP